MWRVCTLPLSESFLGIMAPKVLRTHHIAKALGVHVNTVRLYEEHGYLPPIPRGDNGYREYSRIHFEQAKLVHLTVSWTYIGDKSLLIDLVKSAANDDYGMAMELAYQYLARVRMERTYAESAVEFLERWAAGHLMDSTQKKMHIRQAAQYLNVSVDMLRNWERNGLIEIPRDASNGYRLYGTLEFGRLRVIRMLVQSGYSLMAILRMFRQFDSGQTDNLRAALDLPKEDSANELIEVVADRWLSSLMELEQRAQTIIQQIGKLIEIAYHREA
jgi:DNA-binding transcriptional MerR regulator